MKKHLWLLSLGLAVFFTAANAQESVKTPKLYNSYKGLVMAGYQGWFTAPWDGANRGWYHLNQGGKFQPESTKVDFWPDVSEYNIVYRTPFKLPDGSPAYFPSSYDEETVRTHFRWMQEYGIDGVFMQRFVNEAANPRNTSGKNHFNKVLTSAMKAAQEYDRTLAIMYDLSGMGPEGAQYVLDDIADLEKTYQMKTRTKYPTYLYHNGKPVVTVWGVGFNDNRRYSIADCAKIVDGLKEMGYSVMLGVPTYWREFGNDTQKDPALHELMKRCDIVMPWFVGRYDQDQYPSFKKLVAEDIKWAKKNNVDYAPLCFPGFTWRNMKGQDTRQIQRNGGDFLWMQIAGAINSGAEMIYFAMFDEIDEGTALYKCLRNSEVPLNGKNKFYGIDDHLESDHYLWLVGEAGKWIRGEGKYSSKQPQRPSAK